MNQHASVSHLAETYLAVEPIPPFDLWGLIRKLWFGKLFILAATIICVDVAGYYAFFVAKPKYVARATIQIEAGDPKLIDLNDIVAGLSPDSIGLNTEVAILTSRGLVDQVVTALDLTSDPEFNRHLQETSAFAPSVIRRNLRLLISQQPDTRVIDNAVMRETTIATLTSALSVRIRKNTYVIEISALTGAPDKSTRIVNALAELYVTNQVSAKIAKTEGAISKLSTKLQALEADLETKETAVDQFVQGSTSEQEQTLKALSLKALDLERELLDTEASLVAGGKLLEDFDLSVAANDFQTASTLAQDALLAQLARSGLPRSQLSSQAQQTRARLTDNLKKAEYVFGQLSREQSGLLSRIEETTNTLSELKTLEAEAEATRILYQAFLSRIEEASVQQGLHEADSRVLSHATRGQYTEPRKSLIILIGGISGLILGVALVLFRDARRKNFRTLEELETAFPNRVFAALPKAPSHKRYSILTYLNRSPFSPVTEAYRNLRTSLLDRSHHQDPQAAQVILTTSTHAGEGAFAMATALSHSLAGLEKRVLLVVADLRSAKPPGVWSKPPETTFSVLLQDQSDLQLAVFREPSLAADIILGERISQNPADFFGSKRFTRLMDQMRAGYDHIVIAAPPVLVAPDARILAQFADQIAFGVRWNKTSKPALDAGLRDFTGPNLEKLGLVLTQTEHKRMRRWDRVQRYRRYAP